MKILIYNPTAERKGGFIIDVGQEQAQIDIAVTLPDAVQCMRSAYKQHSIVSRPHFKSDAFS